jgi:DNA polymerase III delta subunit
MLYLFYGTDRTRARDAVSAHLEQHQPPNAALATIDGETYEAGVLEDALGATSLFGGEQWCIVDTPSSEPEFQEAVRGALEAMGASENTFIVIEGSLLAADRKRYEKHAQQVQQFTAEKSETFNLFSLAEAYAARDKRRLWVLVQQARLSGVRPEEIIGMLWWQTKALRLAAATSSAEAAGMKQFPYAKAKQAVRNFPPGELERSARALLTLYHEGHAGETDIDTALEIWVLR